VNPPALAPTSTATRPPTWSRNRSSA